MTTATSTIPASLVSDLTGTPYADIEHLPGFFFWNCLLLFLDAKDREAREALRL